MPRGRFFPVLAGAAFWLLAGRGVVGRETPIPPEPDRWVTDGSGFLSAGVRAALDARLGSFEGASGYQVLVYISRTTGDAPLEDWAARAFREWRVGRRGLDDGLVLFIMAEDRRARIEVGYGLEERVPDIVAGRIINDILIPGIRAGDNDAAVRDAVLAITEAIAGPRADAVEAESGRPSSRPMSPFEKLLVVVAVIGFLILFITNPSLALWLIFSILSGGRGGGGGGGGGFRGGGGRSGGGGASGSW